MQKGHKTIYEYNAQNKLMRRIDNGGRTGKEGNYSYVDGRVESYSYNPDGTLKVKLTGKVKRQTIHMIFTEGFYKSL